MDIDVNVPSGGAFLSLVRDGSTRITVYSDAGLTQAVTLPYALPTAGRVRLYVPPIGQFDYVVTDAAGGVLSRGNGRGLSSAATPLDFATAGVVTKADASGSYVPRKQPVGLATMGDSIASFQSTSGQAWHRQVAQLSQQRIRYRGQAAVSGYQLADGETILLPQILALNPKPQVCVIALGTNDVGRVSPAYSFTESKATHGRIRAALEAAGITPGLWTLPPREDDTTVNGYVQEWNAWIYEQARYYGYPLVDAFAVLVDPATGVYKSALKLDTVHPNWAGHIAVAQAALADTRFTGHFRNGQPDVARSVLTQQNKVTGGGQFAVDTNADGLSDGLSKVGTPALSRVAVGDGSFWQRMSLATAGTPTAAFWRLDVSGITAGNTYEINAMVHADLESSAAGTSFGFGIQPRGAGANVGTFEWLSAMAGVLDTTTMAHRRITAPAGCDTLRFDFTFGGAAPARDVYAEVSRFLVRDVTNITVP